MNNNLDLAEIFWTPFAKRYEVIQRDPKLWAFYEKPVRSCRVQPFPYRLLYRELPDRIQIVAVMHLSRQPGYWKNRI